MNKICIGCKKVFYKSPSMASKFNYCSIECKRKTSQAKEKVNCIQCDVQFERSKSNYIKYGYGKYCSKKCLNNSKINLFMGNKNPRWKGGITEQNRSERNRFTLEIRDMVFERDDYTCQLCNVRGVSLQVDHIQSWSEYIELRFSIDNCRTLCEDCHYKITFGKPKPKSIKTWGKNFSHSERRVA